MCVRRSRRTRLFVCAGSPALYELPAGFAMQRAMLHRQSPKIMRWKAARRKRKKKSAVARWQSAYMHFASIYMLHKAPGKALLGTNSAHFGLFWPFYGSEKAQKLRGAPTKYRQRCVKIAQKWGLGHFGPFGGHFYPFYTDFQRNRK